VHATISGAGKGEKGVCAGRGRERKVLVNDTNREGAGREEKGQRTKRMRVHPFCCIL
jgi:hypothetical protein